jgi:hypothetical protein
MIWINTAGWTLVVILTVYAGMLIFAHYYDCDPLSSGVSNNNFLCTIMLPVSSLTSSYLANLSLGWCIVNSDTPSYT